MLINPFTPTEIASQPEDFFGRSHELKLLERSLAQGSVVIQGGIGIGKSSLLARIRLLMEGFGTSHASKSVVAVGDKDIVSVDDAARLVLESFVQVDEIRNKLKFKFGSIFEIESEEVCNYFKEHRHLAALKRIVEAEYLPSLLADREYLIIAIDEADKCPAPLARLIRSIVTHTQQNGVKNIRFILAGVAPFFQKMVDEDSGVNRFFFKTITLTPMQEFEAYSLLENKFKKLVKSAEERNIKIEVEPSILERIAALSGGHPHLLQLLGSHIVERENEESDSRIDGKDLVNALRMICYEDRAKVYDATIHFLELHNRFDDLKKLIEAAQHSFPTKIDRNIATRLVSKEALEWLISHNILSVISDSEYGLVDQFLRIRMLMDEFESENEILELESKIIDSSTLEDDILDEFVDEFYDPDEFYDDEALLENSDVSKDELRKRYLERHHQGDDSE